MAKPLNENLKSVHIETEEGDLIPVMDLAGDKFADLIKVVADLKKPGKLVLTLDVKASTAGTIAVKADVKVSKPKGMPAESLLWPTVEGNLLAEDPRQTKLDLKQVAPEPARELRQMNG